MIGSSSARILERLTDGDVIVVEVFREPLLGQGLLGVLDMSLRDDVVVGLITCGGFFFFWPRGPAPPRNCAVLLNKKNKKTGEKEIGDEARGEVEEVTQHTHETWDE